MVKIEDAKYRHRRSLDPQHAWPSPLEPGEIAVNTASLQIAVGDADVVTTGVPIPLLAVRFFNVRSRYTTGDLAVMGGDMYQALEIIAPGNFNPAQWRNVTAGIGAGPAPNDGDLYAIMYDTTGAAYIWAKAVSVSGDTMTGPLILENVIPPVNPLAAVAKQWVEKIPIAFPVTGKPVAATSVFIPVTIPLTVPAALAGTKAFASVASTGAPVFTVNKLAAGGTSTALGTITATAGSRTNFVMAGAGGSLAIGDVIQVVSPSPQDTTLADVGITLQTLRA